MTSEEQSQVQEMIRGTHGTSVSRVKSIRVNGFKTSPGRSGTGVYLWADGVYAEELAQEWYFFNLGRGTYADDPQPGGVILVCRAIIGSPGILDLEDYKVREGILSIARRYKHFPNLSEIEITRCYDVLIQLLERKVGEPLQAVGARVAPPPGSVYPMKLLGAPYCFVVRDPSILEVEREQMI